MILVDERVGSRELLSKIRSFGVDAELAGKLNADFQFEGNGPDGTVLVGVERKTITDLVQSMRDGRLAGGQFGRMLETYDISYLVVEGLWRRGRETGLLEFYRGKWFAVRGNVRYAEVDRFLCSLQELGDSGNSRVRLWRTADEEETAAAIADRFQWWNREWREHKSGRTLYVPPPTRINGKGHRPTAFRHVPTLVEKWLACLPGIDSRAIEIAKYFRSGQMLSLYSVAEWMKIKGIGRKTAERVVKEITNGL